MSLRPIALTALVLAVLSVLENAFFGEDSPGTDRHDVSVGFFLLFVASLATLAVVGAVAVKRRVRQTT